MKLQKHYTRKGKKYPKYEVVIPKDAVEKAGFKEGDDLKPEAKKGEIKLRKYKKINFLGLILSVIYIH